MPQICPKNKNKYLDKGRFEILSGRLFKIIKMEIGSTTIKLSKENYNTGYAQEIIPLGCKIGFREVPYPSALRQRIKNKMFINRLLKKKWRPYLKVVSTDISQPYQHTFTLKPYNF